MIAMEEREKIRVFVDIKDGKTVCICKRSRKKCRKNCTPDEVERDRYAGWQSTMNKDKYGPRGPKR